jgi:hypothetical protein
MAVDTADYAALTLSSKGNVALCWDLEDGDENQFSNANLIYIVSIMIPSCFNFWTSAFV